MGSYGRNPMAHVPVTIQGMDEYINEAETPFEKLARLWECEIKQSGNRGDMTTPEPVGKKRWAEFWKIWGETK